MIDATHPILSIARQCELISLSRASYYRIIDMDMGTETPENIEIMRSIDEEYTRHPFYGSRKFCSYFRRQGSIISRKRIQRLMRVMGLVSVAPKPNTSKRNKKHNIYPYLLRDLVIDQPNQVWCTDITYIPMQGGFVYLVAIMDWYSRKVLSWEISNTMEDDFCISALERAIRIHGIPDIFNTDQGSQFTSIDFINILKENNIKISMDGKGRWMDNVFIERLWRSVKYEDVYLKDYRTVVALREGLTVYFLFYNTERPHQSFGMHTPGEIYGNLKKIAA
jgi:putative transposase